MTSCITIDIQDLEVSYTDQVALSIPQGQVYGSVIAIVGHNGAGKSTLMKSILGLLSPQQGQIRVTNEREGARRILTAEEDMAFCPETGAVFSDISVEQYLRFWGRFKFHDPLYFRSKGAMYLDLLEIEPLLKKLGRELSKGQRRRVQTVVGFLLKPRLFLFDEPFDGLDVQKTEELATIIDQHRHEMSFVISSHRMSVVERIADQVMVLCNGALIASGTNTEVGPALAGKSLFLEVGPQVDEAKEALAILYPQEATNKIGGTVSITGKNWDEAEVIQFLTKKNISLSASHSTLPSLTDAMTYHLKRLAKDVRG